MTATRLYVVESLLAVVLVSSDAMAQPTTTVITHGLQLAATQKPEWQLAMAQAILDRAGNASIYRYLPATGDWEFIVNAASPPENDPTLNIVLLFNWTVESDGDVPAPNIGYAEAAADALSAALRDPRLVDEGVPLPPIELLIGRDIHFIGHSRGASVNSETVERLAAAGILVDQVTTLDPHPVNGTLPDTCFAGPQNWGDPVPTKWSNVAWADNYWRADGASGFADCDFDGMPLAATYNVQLNASLGETGFNIDNPFNLCTFEHSLVHGWYHGTIDTTATSDGDCAINQGSWYANAEAGCSNSSCCGYHHSALAGGPRPAAGAGGGVPPGVIGSPLNGDFQSGCSAWLYHGGQCAAGMVVSEQGATFLKLSAATGVLARHNRFHLSAADHTLGLDLRVFQSAPKGSDAVLNVVLTTADGSAVQTLTMIPLACPQGCAGGWAAIDPLVIPAAFPRDRACTLTFQLAGAAATQAIVGIDNITLGPLSGDVNKDGIVDIDDLFEVINAWGSCPTPPTQCPADLDDDGDVDIDDLFGVIGNWT